MMMKIKGHARTHTVFCYFWYIAARYIQNAYKNIRHTVYERVFIRCRH